MKKQLIGYSVALLVGLMFGVQMSGTEYKTKVETKEVEVVREVEVQQDFPDACNELIATAERILKTGRVYDESANGMLDIASRLRLAVAKQDGNEANVIETDLRALNSGLVSAIREQVNNKGSFREEQAECKKELK